MRREVKEIILALNATVDGQTTAHYITDLLGGADVKVTRLAHGVPIGGELDYLDEGTLAAAIRQPHAVLMRVGVYQLDLPASDAKWPRRCKKASSRRLGMAAAAQIAKNPAQPVAAAM